VPECDELAAFLIMEIAVNDPEVYAAYRQAVSANLAAAGGTHLVRGGAVEVLEGDWRPNRKFVVRFDSAEDARQWWNSPDHTELKAMRQRSAKTNMILVEGVSGAL
jgi:uncharacterized protein (DUF1330 family)